MEGLIFPAVTGGGAVALFIMGMGLVASRTWSMRLLELVGPYSERSRLANANDGVRSAVVNLRRWLPWGRGKARESPDLPFLLDLMVIASDSGMNLFQVMEIAAAYIKGPLSERLRKGQEQLRLGRPVVETLEDVALAVGHSEACSLARTLRLSLALGTPMAESLRQSAVMIRRRRRQALEQRFNALPLKLSMCAVFLLFPPWLVLLLLPNVLNFLGGNW